MPITGSKPPFKNITDIVENSNTKNKKNKPDNTIEIPLLKIINYTNNIYGNYNIKTLGVPNFLLTKYINFKIVKFNYIFLKI